MLSPNRIGVVFVSLCIALALCGCGPSTVNDTPRGGALQNVFGISKKDGVKQAEQNCLAYGRTARVTGMNTVTGILTYECE